MGMNPPLTPSQVTAPTGSPDDVEAPGVPAGFPGNKFDDDPIALDQYFEAADSGPEEYGGIKVPELVIPPTNRLIPSIITFPAGTLHAQMLFPADPNRKHLAMSAFKVSDGTVAGFLVSGEGFGFGSALTGLFPQVFPASAPYYLWKDNLAFALSTLDDYTGPIWVLPFNPDPSANVIAVQGLATSS